MQAVPGNAGNFGFLQKLLFDYALFNPEASFTLCQEGYTSSSVPAAGVSCQKWTSCSPTSAHWYSPERFEELLASYLAVERAGAPARTVREFVAEFRGLAGTGKQKQVATQAKLERAYLHDLVRSSTLDRHALQRLLDAMRQASAPVSPELLGTLGKHHFQQKLKRPEGEEEDHSFRYRKLTGVSEEGLPYVVESAFQMTDDERLRGLHVGLNWSVPLSNPLQECAFQLEMEEETEWGLEALLERQRISCEEDSVALVLHLVSPRFSFLDRGKGSVALPPEMAHAVSQAVLGVTKEWSVIKRKQERDQTRSARRLTERLRQGHNRDRVSIIKTPPGR